MAPLSRCMSAAILVLLALGFLPSIASAAGGAAFSLRPVRYDPSRPATRSYFIYDAPPGQVISDQVHVSNTGNAVGTLRLYAVDGTTGDTSGAVYRSAADPRSDVGGWITLQERGITLQPGEERLISFTVTVPTDALPGQHLGGLVAEDVAIKQGASGGALQINLQTRQIVAVQVNLPGPPVDKITVLGVTAGGDQGYQRLFVGLRNDGTEMVKPAGTLAVTDASGQEVQRIALKLDTFVPRTEIQYPVLVERQALGAGTYHASIQLDYGKGGNISYKGAFTITQAEVAQVFQGAQPLAPPQAVASPASTTATRPLLQAWSVLAGGLIVIALGLNLVLFWRWRANRRRA